MADQPLNYAQIKAATHRVIVREAERCRRELKMDRRYAHVEAHHNIAYGALALWEELTTGQPKQDDRLLFNGMLEDIGKPEPKR